MTTIPFILITWLIHAGVAVVVISPVVFLTRKRVHWHTWELLAVVVPFGIWWILMLSDLSTGIKTLSNMVIEPGILALTLALGALARVAMSASIPEKTASKITLVALCFGAAVLFRIVPGLTE